MSNKEFTDLQVFLAEPSSTQQNIIKQYLLEFGIGDVFSFVTGNNLLDELTVSQPDLIISSMYLTDMTGVELLHAIRANENSYDMAYLLISSETNFRYLEPIRQAGAIAILPKPFDLKELDTALSSTLDYLNPKKLTLNHLDAEDIQALIVDDSPLSIKYITRILLDLGIELITTANDGLHASELLQQNYYDLVITDLNMPVMDGIELTTRIRSHPRQKNTPILMVTSEQSQNRLAAIEKAGVSAIVDKPFQPAAIRNMIVNLVN